MFAMMNRKIENYRRIWIQTTYYYDDNLPLQSLGNIGISPVTNESQKRKKLASRYRKCSEISSTPLP